MSTLDLLDGRSLGRYLTVMLVAGSVATVAFDFFGQSLSPLMGFDSLAPVPLATQVVQVLTGVVSEPWGQFLHYLAGLVAYPLGWLILEVLRKRYAPNVPWLLAAVVYGVALWIFALVVMASWIAGNPPFLDFVGITWVALVGHVLFAVVAAYVIRRFDAV